MAALLGDLYSMSNGAKHNNVPRLNNILLNKEKEETENKENYLDDDISQQYSTTEQKPQVKFEQGKQVIKADGIATLEPFDAFSQEIENATNLMRSWRGDGYTPTPSEVQAIRVIASTSSNPKDDVARFVTAAAIHDRIPSITLENAYNNIDSISQYYIGKDYTAFDTSLLEKIDAGFKYYNIMQDMAKWAELDQRNDPKATELEAQIQEKLVALGDIKSAIPTSLFDSISNAVAENFAYMAVPAVKSAFSSALTKTALTKIVSVANVIPSPTIKAAIASMSVGAGILTQYNELSTLQAAQSYWDYMHDYEGQAKANKTTAAIFSSLNGIFVGLTETFLDGVTSRAAGKLISKAAGKTVDQLGVNMLINLDSSGSIGRLGRSIYDWATGAIDEGFVNELPQTLFDELMTAAYKSSIDIPIDFNPGETLKEALNSAATGIVVGAVYGSLGIHSSMVNDRNTAIKLRNTAVKSNSYQEYIYQSADYKPEGVSDEVFDEARKKVWEKWEADRYELLKDTVYESETIAQEELYSTTTEEGEELAPLPSGEVYRTTDNKLYKETIEDKDGSYIVYFGNKESRAVYGNVAIDTDGDTLTVKSVRVRNGYENIRSEMVVDAISDIRTSETNIEWNPTTPGLTSIKEDIINSNPNGKDAGLNYSTIPNSKLKTLESEIQKAFPSLNSQEVKVSAVLYSIADRDNAISDINKGKAFAPTSEIPGDIKAPLGIRGAANKAQALIYTAQNSDASTFTHELFHVVSSLRPDDSAALSSAIRTVLDNEDERQQLAQFIDNNIQIWGSGVSSEEVLKSLDSLTGDEKTWSIPIEEHLARLYEAYRASQSSIDHNLPTGIKNILIKLADAIKKVYRALRDNVPINSNIASAFDKMMGLDNAPSSNGISNLTKINEDSLDYNDVLYQESLDKQYLDAVNRGDIETAQRMVDDKARKKGYISNDEYRDLHAAPGAEIDRKDFANLEKLKELRDDSFDLNLYAIAHNIINQPEDYWTPQGIRYYGYNDPIADRQSWYSIMSKINEIRRLKEGDPIPSITVYRAVPTSIKATKLESSGQWVTPSRYYAQIHGEHRFDGRYRIISQDVPVTELWWDGNDANEWGFDDGQGERYVYKNAKNNVKLIDAVTYDDSGNIIPLSKRFTQNNPDIRFQEVVDKGLLSKLESEETIKAYRAMQLVDGKLYPPMAAIVDGKRVQETELGKWYRADENPNLAIADVDQKTGKQKVDSQGNPKYKFILDKGGIDKETGKTLTKIPAAYNPYWHASLSPLNDQFTTAYKRDNLVTVEVEIPKSELTSGYRAEKAKDAVGLVDWKSGPVSSQLAKIGNPRQVILSRYNKVVRIIPDSEVAAKIADMLKGTDIGIPANTVTPSLAKELINLGVNVFLEDYTAKFYGKDYIDNLLNSLEEIDNKESAKKALLSDAVVYQGPVTDYSNSTLDAPVFDAYIEQGVADAIEYEKLLENTAMIEQEVDDYGTRSREEADPFYVPADFKPADNRQDIKGNIIDNSYDWTYEEFVNANAPEVYYAGTELEKDNQFIEALNNEETLRRYLAIIGEIIHHNTTAVNAGYQTEYNKTYHHEEKVQIIVPFKDQYYRDGLSERMLKQITNLDVRKASEYALNGKEWPKTTGLREAVIKELTDNARYYRNILAILTRDKEMLPSTLIESETDLAIPERDKLDLMSISELSDLAKKIKREDIAAQIEAGKLKVKGDVDEAYLAEISSVIKDQKEQIRKNEDNIKGLESSNKELSSNLAKIQQTLDEREKLIVSSQKILDNINSAITNDISSGRKDIDKQYADLMAEYNNLTDEEYYQKRATAKGSREKGKAEGARLGTMDYMSDMKRMFPYLFEKDGKSLYWTAGKSTNDNKQIRENINNRIEQIKQELTSLKIDMANYSIRSLMINSSKLDEMLAMTKNNVNGLTKILTTEEVNNWNSKLNELSEKNKELKKELNAVKLSKNRKDNKIDALKEQLDKSKDDQALLAKWIAAREKNNQAKLEKKIIDEQKEIYSERIAKLKEKSDLEIKSIKANIAEKQAQKKALDLIKKTKQKLANEIMKPVNLKTVDYDTAAEAILAIQALIDPTFRRDWVYDLRTDAAQQPGGQTMTVQQAKDYFNSLDDAQRIDLSQYLSQDLIDRLTEQKRPLNDWTIDELMMLAKQVNDLKNRGREVLSAKKDLEKARTRQIQKAIINALKHQGFNKKDKDNNNNIPGSLDSSRRERSFRAKYYNARFTTLRMQEIAQLLDGGYGNKGLAYKLLVDDKRYHQNVRDRKIEERFSALDELFTDKAIDAMAEKVTVDLGDGLIKDFTVDQLAYAYLSQRDESTKDAVRYGALLSPEEKGTSIEKSIDIETGEAIQQFLMNDQVIADDNELIQVANQRYNKLLESAKKELADRGLMELVEAISNDFNNPNNALRLNRACIEAYNTPLDMREYYLAIRRVDSNGKELNDSFVANFFDPVTNSIPVNPEQGFRIKRLNISPRHQTNIDMSLINVWSNAVRTQEHLIEHAAYIKQLHNVFNFYGSKEVVSAMDNAFGTALRREIADYIDIVSDPYKGNKIEGKDKLIRTLRGNIGSAYLGWKMSGIVLQAITSPFPGLSELNPAELIGAYMQIARHPIEAIKMINNKSIMMKNRTMNMIIDESLQRRSKWDRNKAQKAFDKFEEVGQLGLTLVDRYAVAGSWLGMYYKTLNANITAGMSSDVAEQSAIKTADDFILRTQPVGDKTELASMFRGNNEAMKALLQFQTSLNVIWNNLTADTIGFVHNGEYSKLIGTFSGYILAGTILGMVSDGFSDDDNKWWKKLIYWAMSQELSSMPVFGSAIDNIAEKLITGNASYTTQGVSIFPAVDKVFQSISAISKGDWQKALQRATEGAEIFTGLPYSGIKEIKEVFSQKSLAPLLGRR